MEISQCTSCDYEMKGISRTCPMCSADMKLVMEDGPRNCPRCHIPLIIHHFNHHDLDTCKECEGMWIEPETFKIVTTEFDVFKDPSSDPNFKKPALPRNEGYLPCANCSQLMVKRQFKRISGVMIDLCIHCGVWLDKGELTNIRNFVASGGLNKAQEAEMSQYKSQTDLRLDSLNKKVKDLEFMDKVMNIYSPKFWAFKKMR